MMSQSKIADKTSKIISIDSKQRTQGTASTFDVNVDMPRSNKFSHVSLLSADIPKSWYMVESGSTVLQILEATAGSITEITSVPDGNYTITELATALQTALIADSPNTEAYTVVYSSVTGKLTITNATNNFTLTADKFWARYLGVVEGASPITTANVLVSANIVNCQRYPVIYVRSSVAINNNDDVLAAIYPQNTNFLDTISHKALDMNSNAVNCKNSNSNSIHINISDDAGKAINLNGVDSLLMLHFWDEY